jgi:hypothetical protein
MLLGVIFVRRAQLRGSKAVSRDRRPPGSRAAVLYSKELHGSWPRLKTGRLWTYALEDLSAVSSNQALILAPGFLPTEIGDYALTQTFAHLTCFSSVFQEIFHRSCELRNIIYGN